jgi:hypothetical protein
MMPDENVNQPGVAPENPSPAQPASSAPSPVLPTQGEGNNAAPAETPAPAEVPPAQATPPVAAPAPIVGLLERARAAIFGRKQKKLAKILDLAKTKGKITNDEVQKLLRCSDKTAERYLNSLVGEGKLKRVGSTKSTGYTPV